MSSEMLSLDTPSPLPLVPYILSGSFHSKAVSKDVIPALELSPENGLPRPVVDNVLRENYQRRIAEAHSTAEAVTNRYLTSDGVFRADMHDSMADYTRFRIIDTHQYANLKDRINLFMDPAYLEELQAYEIFAHQSRELFPDISFARDCLSLIAATVDASIDNSEVRALPKLTRILDHHDQSFRVVMTKTAVGSFTHRASRVTLKSRKAGVINYADLGNEEREIVNTLTSHDPEDGRTDELMDARSQLQMILDEYPTLTHPVVESLYLTREK